MEPNTKRYVLMIEATAGWVPAEYDLHHRIVLYGTKQEAEAEAARDMLVQYQDVIDGHRELDDVCEPDTAVAVTLAENGDLRDDYGFFIGNANASYLTGMQ